MTVPEVKEALGNPVSYNNAEYIMTAYTLRKKDNKLYHQAELQDPCGNSLLIVGLDKIERLLA